MQLLLEVQRDQPAGPDADDVDAPRARDRVDGGAQRGAVELGAGLGQCPRLVVDDLRDDLVERVAAMGSLSSALNSMSNSTVADIIESFAKRRPSDAVMLRLARVMTLVWAVLMAVFAMGFSTTTGNVYLTGLAIAGLHLRRAARGVPARQAGAAGQPVDAILAFVATLVVMAVIVQFVKIPVAGKPTGIAAQWLVPIGVIVTLVVGWVSSRFHEPPEPVELPDADEATVRQAA